MLRPISQAPAAPKVRPTRGSPCPAAWPPGAPAGGSPHSPDEADAVASRPARQAASPLAHKSDLVPPAVWRLNTSNPAKMADFARLFAAREMRLGDCSREDLPEIDAHPVLVVAHKASQTSREATLVEDTSFDVEGADIGVRARWLSGTLPSYVGRRAQLCTLLGFRSEGMVYVCKGSVDGVIVPARGPAVPGFEINPHFLPDGREQTLAEAADDGINPRALAVDALRTATFVAVVPTIGRWEGAWQHD